MFFNKISIIISSSVIVLNSVAMDSALPLSEAQDLVAKNTQLTQLIESKDKENLDLRLKLADLDSKLEEEDKAFVTTCAKLARAGVTATTTASRADSPLKAFCLAKMFDLIDIRSQHVKDSHAFKVRIYNALPDKATPRPGIVDYATDIAYRAYLIPEPSEANGWWDPRMMDNLCLFGDVVNPMQQP